MTAHQAADSDYTVERKQRAPARPSAGPLFALRAVHDWFIPDRVRGDDGTHRKARIFVSSHLTAVPIAAPIALYLYAITPRPGAAFWVLIGLLAGFGVFPVLLKLVGRWLPVALLAMQYFAALILFASYQYGGIASPFLAWLIVAGSGCFFYLEGTPRLRVAVLRVLGAEVAGFFLLGVVGPAFPAIVPRGDLLGLALVSSCVIAVDVGFNSLQFARTVRTQQRVLRQEIDTRRATEISLRRAAEETEFANRAKTEFLSNMSHELRTPLNAIIGFSDILARELFGPIGQVRYAEYARDIHDSGDHLLSIVNDVLDVAKIESHTVAVMDETVATQEIVASCVRLVAERARAGGVGIVVALPPDLPPLRADRRRMKQILVNLLANAVKFTPSGGRVEIRAWADEYGFRIAVADTGIGMSPAEIAVALTAFGQVDSSLARRYEGTGLGLTLANAMVELHGGTLAIESVQNRGTVVTVTLPPERIVDPKVAVAA